MATILPVRRLLLMGILVALVAACGSSGAKNAAVVAGTPIPVSRVDVLMNAAAVAYKKNNQAFPEKERARTSRSATGPRLPRRRRRAEAARGPQLGVRITDAQVAAAVARVTKTQYGGSDSKLADTIAGRA